MSRGTKVSYLVSTYDADRFLDGHIAQLIEGQTDPRFEIVIVNPDSPGSDGAIAQKWEAVDERVKYCYWPTRETYGSSWLRAWKNAKGGFVVNSNADDFHAPRSTEVFYDVMSKAEPEVGFCYGGMQVIDENCVSRGAGLKPAFDFELMSRECWAGPQVCWRNDGMFKNGLDWDLMERRAEEYRSAFDYWLWLYFMSLGHHGFAIQEILTIYTQRADSIENSNKSANNWETYSAISEFFPHNFDSFLKHAKEFRDFENRPPKDEWVAKMQAGKKWD